MQTTERPQEAEADSFAALVEMLDDDQVKALADALENGSDNPLEAYFDWCDRIQEELRLRNCHDHP